jgi:epoxide hydrolase
MAGLRRGSFARSNNICLAATHSFSVAMLTRTAKAWSELMKRLGYNRHVAQGGDLGAGVTTHMGRLKPEGFAAIHLNFPLLFPPPIEGEPDGISDDDLLSFDEVLDDITFYWLTATATSSARLFWESWDKDWGMTKVDIPVGSSIFLGEIYRAPRVWARRVFSNLFYWNELDRGGHFAAHEQPKLFVDEMRACFGKIR